MATVKGGDTPLTLVSTVEAVASIRRGGGSPLLPRYSGRVPVRPVPYAVFKRALDTLISAVALLILSPVFALVALIVRLTSPGPAIFRQTRVGVGGRHFTCFKFRSMCVDAESRKEKLLHLNEVTGPVFKIRNDPRLTPVGRLLRKYSLDELPQLWNVLLGDMSIVGPRPPLPHEVEHYGDRELQRLSVKPGLTCLWQINGRSNIPFEHWIELDLLYVDTMTFWRDISIIVRTVPAVVTGRGAH